MMSCADYGPLLEHYEKFTSIVTPIINGLEEDMPPFEKCNEDELFSVLLIFIMYSLKEELEKAMDKMGILYEKKNIDLSNSPKTVKLFVKTSLMLMDDE